jgi:hypothetical protein
LMYRVALMHQIVLMWVDWVGLCLDGCPFLCFTYTFSSRLNP